MLIKNKGFTLAEVLITLSIIGVVAALTIPSLVRKYEKQQWITGYKAAVNLLSQTTMMIAAENGGTLNGAFSNEAEMVEAYAAHIKGAHTCIDCRPQDGLDFWAYKGHFLNGKERYEYGMWSFIYFNNGSAWLMTIASFPDESGEYVAEGQISIDVNGKKGPNTEGKDRNSIYLPRLFLAEPATMISEGLKYYIPNEEYILENCPDDLKSGYGDSCRMRILRGDYGLKY